MAFDLEKKTRKKKRWGRVVEFTSYERKLLHGNAYNQVKESIKEEISQGKLKLVTPQDLATKHDIRVSEGKRLLRDLEEEGLVKIALKGAQTRFYEPL